MEAQASCQNIDTHVGAWAQEARASATVFPSWSFTAIKLSIEIPFTWSTNPGLYFGSRYSKESKLMSFDSLFLNLMAVKLELGNEKKSSYVRTEGSYVRTESSYVRTKGLDVRTESSSFQQ